jgi:hypothetical protein
MSQYTSENRAPGTMMIPRQSRYRLRAYRADDSLPVFAQTNRGTTATRARIANPYHTHRSIARV